MNFSFGLITTIWIFIWHTELGNIYSTICYGRFTSQNKEDVTPAFTFSKKKKRNIMQIYSIKVDETHILKPAL